MSSTRLTLVLPPLSQLNTPYPSTAYLARALADAGRDCTLRDLGLELMLRVFSAEGIGAIFDELETRDELPEPAWRALALRAQHSRVVTPVIRFLQGKDRTLASRIVDGSFLPLGPRVAAADLSHFGDMSLDDAARRLCTLYIEDLAAGEWAFHQGVIDKVPGSHPADPGAFRLVDQHRLPPRR